MSILEELQHFLERKKCTKWRLLSLVEVVDIWHRGSTHDSETMALVRFLCFCAARYDINVVITYISGIDNCIADSLSRFQLHRFRELAPEAHPLPDPNCAWLTPSFLRS